MQRLEVTGMGLLLLQGLEVTGTGLVFAQGLVLTWSRSNSSVSHVRNDHFTTKMSPSQYCLF
jgi:hypothetical protein